MQGYGPPNAVGLKSSTTGHLLSPRGQWHIYRKPEHVHLGVVNRSCPWDGDTLSLLVVGSERAGDSSRYPSRYLVPAILESDCRLGQRMSPRRRKPGAGPDPKCPTENHPSTQAPKEPFVPDSSLPPPPPPQTNIRLPLASRHPQSRGVTLFAGSICRQGASDAMPSISTTSTQCPADCSVVPNSIHAAFHLQWPPLDLQSSTLETV